MKKIFLIFLTLVILVSAGIVYLNKVFLPLKIKSLIITALEQQIHLPVKLESLEFNIFKGLILRNLSIGTLSDGARPILSLQECSCSFLPLPFFKKQIIIPAVKVKSAVIFLERRADKTLNVSDLFGFLEKSNKSIPRKTSLTEKSKFSVFVYKVTVLNSRIDFEDRSLSPQFAETVGNLNLRLNLCLPAGVKFNLKAEIQTAPPVKIVAEGEYKIHQQQLISKINVKDFSPQEFLVYYQNSGVSKCEGRIDTDAEINFKDEVIDADVYLQAKNIEFVKEKICFKLCSNIKASLKYNLAEFKQHKEDKPLAFSGKADILNLDVSGLEFVEKDTAYPGGSQI
ncbi:MAG: AsmA family protein [Candidatus Omnitrophota bacterium]